MLTTAMTTQISTTRTTWAVLIEVVLDITDAWNEPRSTSVLGTVPVLDAATASSEAVSMNRYQLPYVRR
jgi:hypothetical protein